MTKSIALVFAAVTFFLAGCCSAPQAAKWEYKVARAPRQPLGGGTALTPEGWQELTERFLNDLGKEGWMLINDDEGRVFYFKRPIKQAP